MDISATVRHSAVAVPGLLIVIILVVVVVLVVRGIGNK